MDILTKEELNAIAHAISFAWEQGAIRNPQLGFHLLTGSEKIHQEWQKMMNQDNGRIMPVAEESPQETPEIVAAGS